MSIQVCQPSPHSHCQHADHLSTGGKKILTRVAGKEASKQFWKYHNEGILKKYKAKLQVGSLDTKKSAAPPTPPASPKEETVKPKAESGTVSAMPGKGAKQVVDNTDAEALEPYGDLIPFADPSWYQGVCCPLSDCCLILGTES